MENGVVIDPAWIRVTTADHLVILDVDVKTLVVHLLAQRNYNLRFPYTIEIQSSNGIQIEQLEELEGDDDGDL